MSSILSLCCFYSPGESFWTFDFASCCRTYSLLQAVGRSLVGTGFTEGFWGSIISVNISQYKHLKCKNFTAKVFLYHISLQRVVLGLLGSACVITPKVAKDWEATLCAQKGFTSVLSGFWCNFDPIEVTFMNIFTYCKILNMLITHFIPYNRPLWYSHFVLLIVAIQNQF